MPKSHYAAYLEEREGALVHETERGMAVYFLLGDELYIRDIYIAPEFRRKHEGFRIADEVIAMARERGCKFLTSSVCTKAKGASDSARGLLAYGMQLHSSTPDMIYFIKHFKDVT